MPDRESWPRGSRAGLKGVSLVRCHMSRFGIAPSVDSSPAGGLERHRGQSDLINESDEVRDRRDVAALASYLSVRRSTPWIGSEAWVLLSWISDLAA
jgi:hypothetical protein